MKGEKKQNTVAQFANKQRVAWFGATVTLNKKGK